MASSTTAAIAAALLGNSVASAQTSPPKIARWILNFDVAFDSRTLDATRTAGAGGTPVPGPIYLAGPIYDRGGLGQDGRPTSDAIQRGYHRFFGWLINPAGAPLVIGNHTFDIWGRGKIVVGGGSDNLSAPVAGGTGEFRNAFGEVRFNVISLATSSYRMELDMDPGTLGM
jgi:hypothetical protein